MLKNLPTTPFAAALIHDLKGALNASAMLAGLLVEEPGLVEDKQNALQQIRRASRRGALLLEALAAIEGHSAGQPLHKSQLDPAIIAREAAQILALTAEEEQSLVIEPMPHLRGHPALVRQIYVNLLTNAFKFKHPERPLRVRCGYDRELDAWIVADNGIGIPSERGEQIFEGGARLSARPGSGLGLVIVRWVAEVHGGEAWLASASRQGSTFAFTLPP